MFVTLKARSERPAHARDERSAKPQRDQRSGEARHAPRTDGGRRDGQRSGGGNTGGQRPMRRQRPQG